jgi:hypothetical protein
MLDGCMPLCRWCSWKRRTSSSVAVSGERPMKAAVARQSGWEDSDNQDENPGVAAGV